MNDEVSGRLVGLVHRLPDNDVTQLAAVVQAGGLSRFRARATSSVLRSACDELSSAVAATSGPFVAGTLLGALGSRRRHRQTIDVVWSGPTSSVTTSRLTLAAVVELVERARIQLLFISYVMHPEPSLAAALGAAADRGVEITLVHERPVDNPAFRGPAVAFPQVPARRLCWPPEQRPDAASLHAKVLVVDRTSALVGSANVTNSAVARNLECGVLLHDALVAVAITSHVDDLVRLKVLRPIL